MRPMQIRPTAVTIDLAAVRHNLAAIRRHSPEQAICGVVKADAYGHGLLPVSRALADSGVEWLGVGLIEEGLSLRAEGIRTPILVMDAAVDGGFERLVDAELTPVLFTAAQLRQLAAATDGGPYAYHLKIDTGMSRLGVQMDALADFLEHARAYPGLELAGVLTHFANADCPEDATTATQLTRFREALASVRNWGFTPNWLHCANSAALMSMPQTHTGLLRPGLALYGASPMQPQASQPSLAAELRPAMTWSTRPVHIKTVAPGTPVSYGGVWRAPYRATVATLPVGYGDGYGRPMSGRAEVLVRGQRAPVVGNICMDLCMVDVSHIPDVARDDAVVLLGAQGQDAITAAEMAGWAGTIPYEVMCGVGPRVPRRYVNELT